MKGTDTLATEVVCSCGERIPPAELEAHVAGHGLEPDTYAAATFRQLVDDVDEEP